MKGIYKLKLKFFKSSFRKKLLTTMILCCSIPVFLLGILSYYLSYSIARDKIVESVSLSTNHLVSNIENRLIQIENLSDTIFYYLYELNKVPLKPLSTYLDNYTEAQKNISSLSATFNVFHVEVFLPDESIASNQQIDFFPLSNLSAKGMSKDELYNIGISPKWSTSYNLNFPLSISSDPKSVLRCWRASRNIDTKQLNYAFAINIESDELKGLLVNAYQSTPINAYILDENGYVLSTNSGMNAGTVLNNDYLKYIANDKISMDYNDNKIILTKINNSSLTLITEIPVKYIRNNTNVLISVLVLALIIFFIISITFSYIISKIFTKKLHILSKVIKKVKSHNNEEALDMFDTFLHLSEDTDDEIDNLSLKLRNMIIRNDDNFEKILTISLQKERLNYQLLQAQINPHFLYNILGSIQTCQSIGKIEIANKMTSNLAKFCRHLLHNPDELITIKEEIKVAKLYLELESLCRNNTFSWEFILDDDIENFLICKFTLQPILENCIKHGIKSSNSHLNIKISIKYDLDDILITIKDNGAGIELKKLKDIQTILENNAVSYSSNYGISNVNNRLSSYFSDMKNLKINSVERNGTDVEIRIHQLL